MHAQANTTMAPGDILLPAAGISSPNDSRLLIFCSRLLSGCDGEMLEEGISLGEEVTTVEFPGEGALLRLGAVVLDGTSSAEGDADGY